MGDSEEKKRGTRQSNYPAETTAEDEARATQGERRRGGDGMFRASSQSYETGSGERASARSAIINSILQKTVYGFDMQHYNCTKYQVLYSTNGS